MAPKSEMTRDSCVSYEQQGDLQVRSSLGNVGHQDLKRSRHKLELLLELPRWDLELRVCT